MTMQPANTDLWTGATWRPTMACCLSEAPVAFWMKNTYIPLDMIFLAPSGVVTHIAANAEPLSERVIPSGGPSVAVLELDGGVAASIGLKVGDKVRHPFFKP